MCKNCFVGGMLSARNWGGGGLEWFFLFMCMTLLFCYYEKKVGMKLILYVCS